MWWSASFRHRCDLRFFAVSGLLLITFTTLFMTATRIKVTTDRERPRQNNSKTKQGSFGSTPCRHCHGTRAVDISLLEITKNVVKIDVSTHKVLMLRERGGAGSAWRGAAMQQLRSAPCLVVCLLKRLRACFSAAPLCLCAMCPCCAPSASVSVQVSCVCRAASMPASRLRPEGDGPVHMAGGEWAEARQGCCRGGLACRARAARAILLAGLQPEAAANPRRSGPGASFSRCVGGCGGGWVGQACHERVCKRGRW